LNKSKSFAGLSRGHASYWLLLVYESTWDLVREDNLE